MALINYTFMDCFLLFYNKRVCFGGFMSKIFSIFLFLTLILFGQEKIEIENRCVSFEEFSESQKNIILQAYLAGHAEGFGYTLAAIAWHESCAGEYRVNFQDPSAGIFHAYIPSVFKRHPELKDNGFTHNMIGHRLVTDDDFSTRIALEELRFWNKIHSGNWKNIVKSYNRGFSWQSEKKANESAEDYYASVSEKAKTIERYITSIGVNDTLQRGLHLPIYQKKKEDGRLLLSSN